MIINFSITELSNMTKKSRPTIYKYIQSYKNGIYDDIPYSFIKLFEKMSSEDSSRSDIVNYCTHTFLIAEKDESFNNFIKLVKDNKDKLDFDKLSEIVLQEINNK